MDEESITFNQIRFEEDYSQKKPVQIVKKVESSAPKIEKPTSALQSSRQQNINIVINKIKIKPTDLYMALLIYDKERLNTASIELIIPVLPNNDEITACNEYIGDSSLLPDCDQFVRLLSQIPGFDYRLKSIQFSSTYADDILIINKKIEEFFTIFDFFLNNTLVTRWFEIILAHGNHLNGISAK